VKINGNPASRSFPNRQVMEPDRIGLIGRLFLSSDGTVTAMLEQIVGEKIVTAHLGQSMAPVDTETAALMPFPATDLVTRTTNLTGAVTGTIYVRAKTVFSLDATPPPLRTDLLGTDEPIGRLLRRHRVECFREIISVDIPEYPHPLEPRRLYLVFIGGSPALLIDELFTPSFAKSCLAGLPAAQ
jgi:chorismate-pyruvate lyase